MTILTMHPCLLALLVIATITASVLVCIPLVVVINNALIDRWAQKQQLLNIQMFKMFGDALSMTVSTITAAKKGEQK